MNPNVYKNLDDLMEAHNNPPNNTAVDKVRNRLRRHSFRGYNVWAILTTPDLLFIRIPRGIKSDVVNAYERARYGYGHADTWGLDTYIVSWLPDALAKMRSDAHGHPTDITMDEWLEILLTIETGLRSAREMHEIPTDERAAEIEAEFNRSWDLMGKWFFHLWT